MNEPQLQRKLAALISADVVGYSIMMADDEFATVRSLTACRQRVTEVVKQSGGRLVDFVGDNMLAEFPNTLDAVNCAGRIHLCLAEWSTSKFTASCNTTTLIWVNRVSKIYQIPFAFSVLSSSMDPTGE
jgi:hypothetical protein